MVYPAGGNAMLRTHDRHLELASRAKPEEDAPHKYFGIKEGQNFLVTVLPELNIIDDLVIDYMHNCLLGKNLHTYQYCDRLLTVSSLAGFVKTSFQLTFSGKRMKSYFTRFSNGFESIRLPTEFPRKTRTPIGNLKASEYRTIALIGFVLFGEIFDGNRDRIVRLRRFWLIQVAITILCIILMHLKLALNLQGFLIRAYTMPDEEYFRLKTNLEVNDTSLENLLKQWERAYEELFNREEMVYNVHLWVRSIISLSSTKLKTGNFENLLLCSRHTQKSFGSKELFHYAQLFLLRGYIVNLKRSMPTEHSINPNRFIPLTYLL